VEKSQYGDANDAENSDAPTAAQNAALRDLRDFGGPVHFLFLNSLTPPTSVTYSNPVSTRLLASSMVLATAEG
jgi:hypothetical protein